MNSRQRRLCRRRATRTAEGLRRLTSAAFGTSEALRRFGDRVRAAGGAFATLRTGLRTDDLAGRYLAEGRAVEAGGPLPDGFYIIDDPPG